MSMANPDWERQWWFAEKSRAVPGREGHCVNSSSQCHSRCRADLYRGPTRGEGRDHWAMPSIDQLMWSTDVEVAGWVSSRLTDHVNRVTDIVPSGFAAYARLLHPAERPARGRLPGPVRWREVAAWSGSRLTALSQFHSVAIPRHRVNAPPPWRFPPGPRHGTLTPADAEVLVSILRRSTSTPESCWFCLDPMYGYEPVVILGEGTRRYDMARPPEGTRLVVETPVPEGVKAGPKVELPNTRYLLYRGPIETALTGYPGRPLDKTANLWWPEDRAWCVGTSHELLWTYVAGSEGLVRRLVTESALEVFQVPEDAPIVYVESWILERARRVVDEALHRGHAPLLTPIGTVDVSVLRDALSNSTRLEADWHSVLGFGGDHDGQTWLAAENNPDIRGEMAAFVAHWVVALAGEWG